MAPESGQPPKRRLASEVLQELSEFGYGNPRKVYVGDFNVADPELNFYIIDREGADSIQGARLAQNCIRTAAGTCMECPREKASAMGS